MGWKILDNKIYHIMLCPYILIICVYNYDAMIITTVVITTIIEGRSSIVEQTDQGEEGGNRKGRYWDIKLVRLYYVPV